jgi:formylglycine-generating enzyme required for sulfatase activity
MVQMLENKPQPLFPWEGDYPPRSSSKAGNYADEIWREKFPGTPWIERYRDGYATTAPVMSFKPNKQGLYDMGGNVWEWVDDWYNELQEARGLRGGSFTTGSQNILLASDRHAAGISARDLSDIGFRLVFVPPAKP